MVDNASLLPTTTFAFDFLNDDFSHPQLLLSLSMVSKSKAQSMTDLRLEPAARRRKRWSKCRAIASHGHQLANEFNYPTESGVNMMKRVAILLEVRRHQMPRRRNCHRCPSNYLVKSYYAIVSLMLLSFIGKSTAFHLRQKTSFFYPNLRREYYASAIYFGTTTTTTSQPVQFYSVPVNASETYNLDAIEKEISSEQASQRSKFNKSSRWNKRKAKKRTRNDRQATLPPKLTDKSNSYKSDRRKGRRIPRTIRDDTQMPPWLSRYENEDFVTSTNYFGNASSQPSTAARKPTERDISHMQRLHLALNGIFRHQSTPESASSSSTDTIIPDAIPYFSQFEIYEIMDSIRVASNENTNLMAGCADFLYLMLTLEEEGVLTRNIETMNSSGEPWDDDDIGSSNGNLDWENGPERFSIGDGPEPFSIMTRDVLVAAAFHYCDCVRARKAGVYEYARQAMEASLDMSLWKEPEDVKSKEQLSLPSHEDHLNDVNIDPEQDSTTTAVVESEAMVAGTNSVRNSPVDYYGDESVKIVAGAARLKRAEIMATTVNSSGSLISKGAVGKASVDAEILRSFLVSLSEDWRALVIRSAACLYRLKGITDDLDSDDVLEDGTNDVSTGSSELTRSTNVVARDAFKVYAPLAQRLGMHRLKSELENRAFRILYPRQYSVASSLYTSDMDEMKSIVHVLSSRIEQLLKSDQVLIDQVEEVTVTSRVKEPYSLWRKMIRYRKEAAGAKNNASTDDVDRQFVPALKWIPDVIALRVVLRARRLSSLEDEESLSTREKMMCYYALQLISDVWPASTCNEAKDYIKYPKPNGYQSLHYTASLTIAGEEWPFEVQIRTSEMHRVAEFGVAAHWDYKLQNKVIQSLPESYLPEGITPVLPPLSESIPEEQTIVAYPSRAIQKGRIASYIDALATSRETIVQNNRFVFLSSTEQAIDGNRNIVSIDPSATQVADVLKKFNINGNMLDDISTGALTIYRNGVSTSLDEELYNGDVLTLPSIILDNLHI